MVYVEAPFIGAVWILVGRSGFTWTLKYVE